MSKNWMVLNFMKLPTVHYSSILVDEILRIAEDMEITKFKAPHFFPFDFKFSDLKSLKYVELAANYVLHFLY